MSFSAGLNSRLTRLAVGRHLAYRTVRLRLTLLYGGLFLLSGAALMAIAYALLVNAGFVFSLQSSQPAVAVSALPGPTFPRSGTQTHPSAQTMAHWRGVTQCMHQHGVSWFPEPTSSIPTNLSGIGQIDDRDGAILAIPASHATDSSPSYVRAAATCGYQLAPGALTPQQSHKRTQVRQELLIQSALALAAMSLLSLGLGWLVAGRVLAPLEDSYEAQRRFVANASHELRAPLTRQRALIEVALASSEADVASLRKAHQRVLASEQHLEQLIDALLALTRGQAGVERVERFDLAALVTRTVVQGQRSEAEAMGLDLRAKLQAAPTAGDPRLLERLIANLVENAIRHNLPGGRVEITTGVRDRHAFVSVANTGPAVPPDQVERLFQPFERLEGARTRHDAGHGLGLSIVRAIADAHRAELSARARPQGGLAIEVSFPPAVRTGSRLTFATGWIKRRSPRASLGD